MARRRIRPVLAACVGGAVVGTGLVAALVAGHLGEHGLENAAAESLQGAASMFAALERAEVAKMAAALDEIRSRDDLRQAFLARDRGQLQALAEPIFAPLRERSGITHWYFVEPNRTCFLRVHRPDLFGDRIERATLARAAETGATASGMELGQTAFALRVVRPWFAGRQLIGFVEMAEEIDHFLVRMKRETGNEFGLVAKKKYMDERAWYRVAGGGRDTWNARPEVVVVDSTSFGEGLVDFQGSVDSIPVAGQPLGEEMRNGRALIRGIFPVHDAADRRVGALLVQHDFTVMHNAMERTRGQVVVAVLLLSLAGFGLAWVAIELLVLRRLARAPAPPEPDAVAEDGAASPQTIEPSAALRQPAARQSDAQSSR